MGLALRGGGRGSGRSPGVHLEGKGEWEGSPEGAGSPTHGGSRAGGRGPLDSHEELDRLTAWSSPAPKSQVLKAIHSFVFSVLFSPFVYLISVIAVF